jgi:hypothetical protein
LSRDIKWEFEPNKTIHVRCCMLLLINVKLW